MADPDAIYELAQRIESNIEVDKRVAALHSLQSQIESAGYVVEADAVTSAVKVALKHSNQALSTASLSFIPTYASMIYSGDGTDTQSVLNHNVRMLVNSVTLLAIEKLGDQKERIREAARTALIELGNAAYAISSAQLTSSGKGKETETPLGIFERTLREGGLSAKMARVREQSVLLLPILRQNCEKYPVRPLLPITVELLLDADATVREGARSTLVSLFSSAAPGAKADLKKELEKRAVRKQTADGILREVLGAPSASTEAVLSPPPPTASAFAPTTRSRTTSSHGVEVETPTSYTKATASQAAPPTAQSAAATAEADDIRPVYIASRSDLERTFATMMPFFESKESEHNWLNREQSMIKIRGLIVSGAHRQFGEAFFVGQLKSVQEGILKSVASLRTTLSMHGVHLVQELAIELGDDLGPCVEAFLIHLIGMAGFTKKLIANATQEAAAAIMINVSFRPLYLQLIWQGMQDKNVATRTATADHLCTVLNHHAAHRKHAVESHGGLDLLDKCMRKGVGDSNPAARTKGREAFWIFHRYWPDQANVILNSLDPSTKKQVAALAPADVETEAIVEQKPKAGAGPVRARPGGASMALIQAKKAAAAKAAQERERKKAEDAAAAHEARVADARAALAEQQQRELQHQQYQQHHHELQRQAPAEESATPVAKRSTGFMPIRKGAQQSSQASNLRPSTELSVLVSPTAHQRIETAIAVPLPTSPTPVALDLETPQPRRGPASSQVSSPGLSPGVARNRAISSSSLSSQGSGSGSSYCSARVPASSSTPRLHRAIPTNHTSLDADLENLSIANFDADDTSDATQLPRFNGAGEDDTVQLSAPEDASMDLMGMNFTSPFKLPVSATTRAVKTQSVLVERQNALDSLQSTPQPKTQRTASTSSGSSGHSGGTPGSARRSGLPRPVSMLHTPSPNGSRGGVLASTPSRHPPQVANGGSALENRGKRLDAQIASPSPAKAKPEVWGWIRALEGQTADVRTFRRLARLSAEFKVSPSSAEGGDETLLHPGPNGLAPKSDEESFTGTDAWLDGGLFSSLFGALKPYLSEATPGELQLSAQVVLHRLVENQASLFAATGKEGELLDLLLTSIASLSISTPAPSSMVVARKTALQGHETILSTWASHCDPILSFDLLPLHPGAGVTPALLRSGYTPLLLRLPAELVLDDFLPRLAPLLKGALTAPTADLRLVSTTMLKKLNAKCLAEGVTDSHGRIFAALGLDGEDAGLLDVLMYYFSKK
ncbi:CLASP N-terminal domain protein [Kalmanozyma brasiliensis GHG001]|uniref:TOG domain-containing protein n=1 Tax=Kalmanozyma brasiliensis (strain GHG001) TaxID=1365824 RepID=V5EE75_KALBG|nr:CLASP N-terminal domain protein [Kalmanozyma brasiliensis GHG001]EST08791.1 CLASP N-terminal domain protein [Kalmanozyma brasiliensis GHG001]